MFDFTTFGKWMQYINGPPFTEAEQTFHLARLSTCYYLHNLKRCDILKIGEVGILSHKYQEDWTSRLCLEKGLFFTNFRPGTTARRLKNKDCVCWGERGGIIYRGIGLNVTREQLHFLYWCQTLRALPISRVTPFTNHSSKPPKHNNYTNSAVNL